MTRVCPRCSTPNSPQTSICTRCGLNFNTLGSTPYAGGNPGMPPQQGYAQSGYAPAPGAYSQPPYQNYPNKPPKKGGAGLVIAIIVVLLIILGGGGYFAYTHFLSGDSTASTTTTSTTTPTPTVAQTPTAEAALTQACQDLKANDYQDLYQLGSQNLKQQVSNQEFLQLAAVDESITGGVKTCTVSNVQTNGNTATGVVTVTTNKGQTESNTESLILEQNQWKINTNLTK